VPRAKLEVVVEVTIGDRGVPFRIRGHRAERPRADAGAVAHAREVDRNVEGHAVEGTAFEVADVKDARAGRAQGNEQGSIGDRHGRRRQRELDLGHAGR
jgi:hypothetical protein